MTEGALRPIGEENSATKHSLMKSPSDGNFRVLPPSQQVYWVRDELRPLLAHTLVDRHHELSLIMLFAHQPHGEDCFEDALGQPPEPNQRPTRDHGMSQSHVVVGLRIRA